MDIHYSERSNSEAMISSDEGDSAAVKEDINTFAAKKK